MEQERCIVCLESDSDTLVVTNCCGQSIHFECLKEPLESSLSRTCPHCRVYCCCVVVPHFLSQVLFVCFLFVRCRGMLMDRGRACAFFLKLFLLPFFGRPTLPPTSTLSGARGYLFEAVFVVFFGERDDDGVFVSF